MRWSPPAAGGAHLRGSPLLGPVSGRSSGLSMKDKVPLTPHDRAHAFEKKYAHDEALRFRAVARRDKLFAHWVSGERHLPPADADRLRRAVLSVGDGPAHDDALLGFIQESFASHGGLSRPELVAGLAACGVPA